MTTRRGFLGAMLSLVAAPSVAGFAPSAVAVAVAPGRYINVLDYGAARDGITDDGPAIRRALAACRPGGTVFMPAGTYAIGPGPINGGGRRLLMASA